MTKKGIYISIDGMDGVGKTMLANNIVASFNSSDVVLFGSLTTNPVSKKIREILTNIDTVMLPKTEALLLAAAHWENYYSSITKLLDEGKIVVADRSAMTALAYQGYAYSELTGDTSNITLIEPLLNKLMADIQIVITGNPYKCLQRCKARDGVTDRVESREIEFHVAVNEFFRMQGDDASVCNRRHIHNDGSMEDYSLQSYRAIKWIHDVINT